MITDLRKRTQYSFKPKELLISQTVHSVQWRPNIDEVVIFGDHTSKSLARSLSPSHSLTSPHLTSIQRNVNVTQLNQSFNQIIHLFTNILI